MLTRVPDHFSSNLKFDFAKLPATVTDRSSALMSVLGIVFGSMLLGLGLFELLNFINAENMGGKSLLTVEIGAVFVIFLALGLIIGSVFSFIRAKKIFFDGKEFKIFCRPAVGVTYSFSEPLSGYAGVRLRVLFIQSGLFNKNRYIIDLYHQDPNKIIPLYISTKNKNIRKIWEGYAKMFKLPALSIGDRGLVQREYTDLDKSLKELADAGKLPFIASGKFPAPSSLEIEEKKLETVIEPAGIYWDTFSTLFLFIAIAAVFLLTAGGVYLTIIGTTLPLKYWALGAILLVAVAYFALKLFNSYRLIISDSHIAVCETLFGSVLKTDTLDVKKIENVELSYNPTIDRYSLAVISDDKIITFGSRLPVSDLLWLKDYVIRKLTGN